MLFCSLPKVMRLGPVFLRTLYSLLLALARLFDFLSVLAFRIFLLSPEVVYRKII